ncbi:metalloprotease TIKI1 isoform X2 [Pteropus vampyrus]|uniref:Metalloprotease TIKI n=1 Tax=Pteropus vampyrus TaxID=132908 RepID=A0A6P6CZ25_PTEVA|nr:metalloprotease TIKI1 isoform X2 [Pteropus vampyrus]
MLKLSNFIHNSVALNFIFLFLTEVPNFINSTLQPQERITAQGIDNYFHQELIYKRNERMGKRVKAVLEELSDKGFFLAFGAGHFMGNNTVLDVLLREGYEITVRIWEMSLWLQSGALQASGQLCPGP